MVLFLAKAWQIVTTKLLEQSWKYICLNITTTQQNDVDLARNNGHTEEDFEGENDLLLRILFPSIKIQI